MLLPRAVAISLVSVAALGANVGFGQAAAHPSDGVSAALGVLNRVVGHTQRLIAAKNFTRLPHEDGEFKEGVEALENAIAREPADLKREVEPLIKQAGERSHALAVASGQGDPATLDAAHHALADSVRTLIAAFPEGERPSVPTPPAAGAK
jgi:hypothetical protein